MGGIPVLAFPAGEDEVGGEVGDDFGQDPRGGDGVRSGVSGVGQQYRIKADPTPQDVRPNTTSSVVICDYTVHLINGYKVAGGHDTLYLPSCIPGFAEGCHLIHNNGDISLYIPYYLGYDNSQYESGNSYNASGRGTEGTSSYIPPYSTLIYDIHLCAVIGY